ncbi:c-type cytochrome [Tateyamaria omphalii]|uniref:Cytochrome c class I n=1 Tax=Tateyamaria omphalii TaxID=299262 RepID=A0A1P8MRG2_9RHOB|nr:c-type cytochrome [Tateyamaria omphalii]APX10559.1 cytochrome c class I [Tateyamaria omphalii]
MSRRRTYVVATVLVALSCAAMGWAAVRPGDGIGHRTWVAAGDALRHVGDWYRSGPADRQPDWDAASLALQGADASRGPDLMIAHGCGSCHVIPGVSGARGTVGPSLAGLRHRSYVAGVLPNDPGSLVRWLMNPTVHAPQTAMPDLGVTERQARDMAAYLYTLRGG